MELKLAENIRAFRKERSLTQEQLAEVLGVTVGAVYKWEAKLSQPELSLIMAMADFFDTSVDVLLGYEMRNNQLRTVVERLRTYCHAKDVDGISEAEKALKKYPNSFEVVYWSAALYRTRTFGQEKEKRAWQHRALELLERARVLLPQNTDPEIGEQTLYGQMAEVYLDMGEGERAVELLKEHNAGRIFQDVIGFTLAGQCNRPDEALPYLSEALLENTTSMIRIIMGYLNVFQPKEDYESEEAILRWGIQMFSGLKKDKRPNSFDKVNSVFHVFLAYVQMKNGDKKTARVSLSCAKEIADSFDKAPEYDLRVVRFVTLKKQASAFDDFGETARKSIENTLDAIGDEELSALWEEVDGE